MLKATKNVKDFELSNVIQNQQYKRKRKKIKVYKKYTQKTINDCKTSAASCFVSFARRNSLKQVENFEEKAKKAVFHRGNSFTFVKTLSNLIVSLHCSLLTLFCFIFLYFLNLNYLK